jgi:hypothetical protein
MNGSKICQPDGFPFHRKLMDYPHVPMMLSVPLDPWEVSDAVNESAASPKISEVDRQIDNLCDEYCDANEQQRIRLRQEATNGWSLLHYAHRMAIRGMRTNDPGCIWRGLISLLLESARSDPRETIVCLAMLCHAASYIRADFAHLAGETTEIASPEMVYHIQEFVQREPRLKSLGAMGLRKTQDANGPRIDFDLPAKPPRDRILG